jgi:phenylacetate-CoA ligase
MNDLFYALPPSLKNFATSIVAFNKSKKKYGRYYNKYLDFLINSSADEKLEAAQMELDVFLDWSVNNIPILKKYKGFKIEEFPVIDKKFVIANYEQLTISKPYIVNYSSGSTGLPLRVPLSIQTYQKEYAYWSYHRSFANVARGEKVATFAGHKIAKIEKKSPPFWVYNRYENQIIFSSYHLSNDLLNYYLQQINIFKPTLINGYPSSLYLLAKHIVLNNSKLEFQPKMIVTASETLFPFQRDVINKAFNCKVYNWYGNTEMAGSVIECEYGQMHVQDYHSFIRVLDDNNKMVRPGGQGNIVATNFTNISLPLINYNTGDTATLSEDKNCKCNRGGVIIDKIDGRQEDYILTSSGRFIGRLDHIFKKANHIRNAQIEQDSLDSLVIRIVRTDNYSKKDENYIIKEAKSNLGNEFNIIFDYVDNIPKSANGKFNFIIQKIRKNRNR